MKYIKSHAVFQRYLSLSRIAHKKNAGLVADYYAANLVNNSVIGASEAVN